jgi:hypothetical protein
LHTKQEFMTIMQKLNYDYSWFIIGRVGRNHNGRKHDDVVNSASVIIRINDNKLDAFDWVIGLWTVWFYRKQVALQAIYRKQVALQVIQRMRVIFDAFASVTIGLFRK